MWVLLPRGPWQQEAGARSWELTSSNKSQRQKGKTEIGWDYLISKPVTPLHTFPSKTLQTVPTNGDQVFKCLSLRETFLIQTTTDIKHGMQCYLYLWPNNSDGGNGNKCSILQWKRDLSFLWVRTQWEVGELLSEERCLFAQPVFMIGLESPSFTGAQERQVSESRMSGPPVETVLGWRDECAQTEAWPSPTSLSLGP